MMTDYALSLQRKVSRHGRPLAVSTQAGTLAGLRFFFDFLVKTGMLLFSPMSHLPRPRLPMHLPRPLRVRQITTLLKRLPETPLGRRDRAMVELLYGTGMRRGELAHLKLEDLDGERGQVFIREGKGRKDRVVPLGRKAEDALTLYLEEARGKLLRGETRYVFLGAGGRPLSGDGVTLRLKVLGERAKMRVRPHLLRHSCATHLLRGRADIRQIQRLLGHESLRTTERYTRVEVSDLQAVIRRCHPREKSRV